MCCGAYFSYCTGIEYYNRLQSLRELRSIRRIRQALQTAHLSHSLTILYAPTKLSRIAMPRRSLGTKSRSYRKRHCTSDKTGRLVQNCDLTALLFHNLCERKVTLRSKGTSLKKWRKRYGQCRTETLSPAIKHTP